MGKNPEDMADWEMRRAIAEALGWTQLDEYVVEGELCGVPPGESKYVAHDQITPNWLASVDLALTVLNPDWHFMMFHSIRPRCWVVEYGPVEGQKLHGYDTSPARAIFVPWLRWKASE